MKPPYAVERVLGHFPHLEAQFVTRRLKQSSFVSIDKRYMYFEVPKAACTQMKELLRTIEGAPPIKVFAGGAWETRRDMFIHSRSNVPLPSLVELDDTMQREVLDAPDICASQSSAILIPAWLRLGRIKSCSASQQPAISISASRVVCRR